MVWKKLSWSEELVGRKLPKESPYIDQIMAGFVKADGTFCGRMEPGDRWLRPAWSRIKRAGWVEPSFGFGKGMVIYFLTERGKPEGVEAKGRVVSVCEARAQWSRDFAAAHDAAQRIAA